MALATEALNLRIANIANEIDAIRDASPELFSTAKAPLGLTRATENNNNNNKKTAAEM